jgi:hypothetical protein
MIFYRYRIVYVKVILVAVLHKNVEIFCDNDSEGGGGEFQINLTVKKVKKRKKKEENL